MSVNSKNSTDKRVLRTKKAIRSALFKLMETKDLASITISELAALANINRRTFYTHYSNISDILDETESEIVEALKGIVSDFDYSSLTESVYTMFIKLSRLVTVEYGFYFHLLNSDFRGVLISRMKSVLKTTADHLLGGLVINNGSDYAFMVSSFINGGFLNLFQEWNKSDHSISIESAAKVASVMVDYCVRNSAHMADAIDQINFPEV